MAQLKNFRHTLELVATLVRVDLTAIRFKINHLELITVITVKISQLCLH